MKMNDSMFGTKMEQNRPEMKIKAVVMKNRNLIIFYFSNFKIFCNCWQPVNTVMIHLEIIISHNFQNYSS